MTDEESVAAAPQEEGPAEAELQARLSAAEATAQENWDKFLRANAELDNVRKRAIRDVEQARKMGIERLAGELLEVIDNLERGVEAGTDGASAEVLLEGQQATLRLLMGALGKFGISAVEAGGQPFDPQFHEALSVQPTMEAETGTVLTVIQKGYQLNGRLLRPARVIVAGAPAEPETPAAEGQPDGAT